MIIALGTIFTFLCTIALFAIMMFSVWDSVRDGYQDWREDCKKSKKS